MKITDDLFLRLVLGGTKAAGGYIELTDDAKADMQRIYDIYRPMGIQGKHKDGFVVP